MQPSAEFVHWLFATGFLVLGLCLLGEAIVGTEVWNRRPWRAYLWPSSAFLMGIGMWPVMILFTNSTLHMVAHSAWAQVLMLAGGAELALARGKLSSPYWHMTAALALVVSGFASLVHEQNPWLFSRSAFIHHSMGWVMVVGAIFPLARTFRPRSFVFGAGFAATFLVVGVLLYAHRDVAPIFGHLSPVAGEPHR
ncbi:MAG TPA: hypothetical protein VE693_00600 [Gaiellaceae bacterium]|jgi:hypothetical protein|nr:hypothetical protein [Gaiellaceae bacterium]